MRYRLQRHDGTDCSATMVPITVLRMVPIQRYRQLKNELPYNTLFYLDPPYYVKGKGLYLNYYNDTDHQNIANTISEIANCKWIVSYDNVPFITSLYSKYRQQCFELNYSASNSGKGKEIMVFCDGIVIPKHKLFNHSTK